MRIFDNLNDLGLLALRLFGGLTMLSHGVPKLLGFGDMMNQFPDPIGLGSPVALGLVVFAEGLCALLVALGVLTRLASVPLFITMFVAFFAIHGGDPFSKKELPFLYMGIFLVLILTGGGKYSLLRNKTLALS